MQPAPTAAEAEAIAYLRTPEAIRARAEAILAAGLAGRLAGHAPMIRSVQLRGAHNKTDVRIN